MLRRLPFLLLALLISGATVLLAQFWIRGQVAGRAGERPTGSASVHAPVRVLVAKVALPAGAVLQGDSVRWQAWPQDDLDGAYLVQGQVRLADFAGAVARSPLTPGEPITADRVARPGERSAMAVELAPGHRAVTINVTPATGMAGFVSPGDRVDLILSMVVQPQDRNGATRHVSETVLTDLRVLGSDQKLIDDKKDVAAPRTVTLEVTPKQAEIVAVVTEMGLLSISLRSLAGGEDAAPRSVTRTWDKDAIDMSPFGPMAGGAARPRPRVTIIRGSALSEVALAGPGAEADKP